MDSENEKKAKIFSDKGIVKDKGQSVKKYQKEKISLKDFNKGTILSLFGFNFLIGTSVYFLNLNKLKLSLKEIRSIASLKKIDKNTVCTDDKDFSEVRLYIKKN